MPRRFWKRKRYFLWCRMNILKFLIDENIGRSVIDYLLRQGFDIIVAKEEFPGREDLKLVDHAYREDRIIITNDKGFGFYSSTGWSLCHKVSGRLWSRGD